MTARLSRFAVLVFAWSAVGVGAATPPPRPNVLVILTDDQGWGDTQAQGAPDLRTPHLDELFRAGLVFENFYANSPVCSPTRAALLSGRFPDRVGVPGVVGDGAAMTLDYGNGNTVSTRMGKKPTAETLKRFFVGPFDCEVTGLCETPDGKTLFVNIQHPGENTPALGTAAAFTLESGWPGTQGYGPTGRPRSATLAITRTDGDRIGV